MTPKPKAGIHTPTSPKATGTGAELVLVGPAVALVKHVYDAIRDGRPAVHPADPLVFAVADSRSNANGHVLTVICTNLGPHGVYIDDVDVDEPTNVQVRSCELIEESKIGDDWSARRSAVAPQLPVLVRSAGLVKFEIELTPFATLRREDKPFGALHVKYAVLGVAGTRKPKTVEFVVR